MNKLRKAPEVLFYLSAITLLVACGAGGDSKDGGGNVSFPATLGTLVSLQIAPAASSANACSAVQFAASGTYADGSISDVTNLIQWAIDPANSGVAIANASNGQVMGINPGSATVIAYAGIKSASAVLSVTGSLSAINITPASATVAVSGTQPYTAMATCTNGPSDITSMGIWTSGNSAVASISTSGVATALAVGSSAINAKAGAIAGSAVLNVQ